MSKKSKFNIELLAKFGLGELAKERAYEELFPEAVKAYTQTVADLRAQVEVTASGEQRVRTEWLANPEYSRKAALAVRSAINVLVEAIDECPQSAAAIYFLANSQLLNTVKSERDENVSVALRSTRKFPEVPKEDLDGLREAIFTLYHLFSQIDPEVVEGVEVKFSKSKGVNIPKLPTPPTPRNGKYKGKPVKSETTIRRRLEFTVDGVPGDYTPIQVRKIANVESVPKLYDALGISGSTNVDNDKVYTATFGTHVVTCKISDIITVVPTIESILEGGGTLAGSDVQEPVEEDEEFDDDEDEDEEELDLGLPDDDFDSGETE